MIDLRQEAFNSISRVLAITRYDIEQRQLINEYSLNIHAENYFRDVFNFVYGKNYENENFYSHNNSCIDLVDKAEKIALQITTTRTKEKIDNTFNALKLPKYKDYSIKIFYLLDKSKPKEKTIALYKKDFGIDLNDCMFDYTDLIKKIEGLDTPKLIELNNKYFNNNTEKYTDEIVLNLVFRHLIKNFSAKNPNYDDDFGTIDTNEKIKLNNINSRFESEINKSLDYISLINDEDNLLSDLRKLVVDDLYKEVLIELLLSKVSKRDLENKTVSELNDLCQIHKIDFNKIISNLRTNLESKIDIEDFNSMSITWIIISFFFEICDIGLIK